MKKPTQQEVRDICARNNRPGAAHMVIYGSNGKPQIHWFGTLTKEQASLLLTKVIAPAARRAARKKGKK